MRNDFLKCSNCGYDIPVESALYKQIEEKVKKDADKKDEEQLLNLNKQKELLKNEKKEFEEKKASEEEVLKKRSEELAQKEKELNKKDMSAAALNDKIVKLEKENAGKDKEIDVLLRRERELAGKQEESDIETQKKLLEEKDKIETETKRKEYEKYALLIKEYDRKISDQKKTIEDLRAETEKTKLKINAEDREAPFEEKLKSCFTDDNFEAIGGIEGFEFMEVVINDQRQECGRIIYEGVKGEDDNFGGRIRKLKEDREMAGVEFAVLVSNTLPGNMEKLNINDGLLTCRYGELKNVAVLLRQMLLREYDAKESANEKNRMLVKMGEYLSGNEFRDGLVSIVTGSSTVKEQINKEKQAMHSIWAQREKQADLIIESVAGIYGNAKGIGGDNIREISMLELREGPEKTDKKK